MPHPPLDDDRAPRRTIRYDLRPDDEYTFTQDQIMLTRGYEPKPGGGWRLKSSP